MPNNTSKRGNNANKRPPPISIAPEGMFWDVEDRKWRTYVELSLPTGIKRGRPNTRKNRKNRKNSRR